MPTFINKRINKKGLNEKKKFNLAKKKYLKRFVFNLILCLFRKHLESAKQKLSPRIRES